jgi:hypothetical protein
MEATRVRFGSILEWLLAAALVAGTATLVSIVFSEIRSVRPIMPVIAGEALVNDIPAGVPPRSVSLPMLLLENGREVRLGDRATDVAARLGDASRVISESLDRSEVRERVTRFYNYLGTQFVLVFEDVERNAEWKVAAIYLR